MVNISEKELVTQTEARIVEVKNEIRDLLSKASSLYSELNEHEIFLNEYYQKLIKEKENV